MNYTVVSGDSFYAIADKLGVSREALTAANPGINIDVIQPGQVLNVPGPGGAGPSPVGPIVIGLLAAFAGVLLVKKLGKRPNPRRKKRKKTYPPLRLVR